jgi:hypothetical protein
MKIFSSFIIIVSSLLLVACAEGEPPSQPNLPAPQGAVTVVSTSAPQVVAQVTRTPNLNVTIESNLPASSLTQCPPIGNPASPAKPASFAEMPVALNNFLNAGASLQAASDVLLAWGVRVAAPGTNEVLGTIEFGKLLPGDDPQIVAVIFDPAPSENVSRAGNLIVYNCAGGRYQIAYQALADPAYENLVSDPRLLSLEDVTGDGIDDLTFLTGDCGAGTCMDGVSVLSIHGTGALRNLAPDFANVPNPTFEYAPSTRGGGKDLIVVEGTLDDASAGPQRQITATWSFNGQIFTQTQTTQESPTYRIHALHDGDEALRKKDFREADTQFLRVINDASLQTWDGNPNAQIEQQILSAFAYVRLMQSAALRNDAVGVQVAFDSLMRLAPADTPGYLYAQLGDTFFRTWSATKNAVQSCQAMVDLAKQNANATKWLGIDAFGTANYDYQPEDMCVH